MRVNSTQEVKEGSREKMTDAVALRDAYSNKQNSIFVLYLNIPYAHVCKYLYACNKYSKEHEYIITFIYIIFFYIYRRKITFQNLCNKLKRQFRGKKCLTGKN